MCGIAGLIGYGPDAQHDIERMKERMVHRGPDMGGTWHSEEGNVWFGHRRLSILDLSEAGMQPMSSHDGRYEIVLNGEIYNFEHLKKRLMQRGICVFRGTSDTEVLVEALEHLGVEETLREAKGMFAFAFYDNKTGKLVLARDRIGEKPLYYGYVASALVFASDIGCIRVLSHFDNPVNTEILNLYMAHGYIPAPHTIYKGVYKLLPGTIMEASYPYDEAHITFQTYWSVTEAALAGRDHPFQGSFEEASAELERLLKQSVADQMVADVPVGAFLSGGIDSATTVALMQAVSPGKVRSFTIGMEDPAYNEATFAKEIAEHLGTEHTELYITEADAKAVIPLLPAMFSEPFADSSQIPTYLVSKMTRQHVTVSLSGDAGDELFGGYNSIFHFERIWNKISCIPMSIRKAAATVIEHSFLSMNGRFATIGKMVAMPDPEQLYRSLYNPSGLYKDLCLERRKNLFSFYDRDLHGNALGSVAKDMMLQDMVLYHPDDILVKVDRTAMANSLETRVPFLDKDVVEFAWTLPVDYLRKGSRGKLVLRDVLYRHVPEEMVERPKTGFSIPIHKWLKEKVLRDWAEDLLSEKKIKEQGFLNPQIVGKLWKGFMNGGQWNARIWHLLMFQAWYEGEYKKGSCA